MAGRKREDLDRDEMLTFALVHAVQIIGEAAGKVTPEGQALAVAIPRPDVTAMRNRIVHAYYDIDLDRVWDTVTDDLPPLVTELTQALARYDQQTMR